MPTSTQSNYTRDADSIVLYRRIGKRTFDFVISLIALILLSPLLIVLAVIVRIKLSSPVLFRQARPGYQGKPFTLYKFRTMTDARDANGVLLADAERLVPLGSVLRRTSLDELPELWNVLKGEMSLVGPRPLLIQYLKRYTPEQMRRHAVRPGITGWAQVHGRQEILFSQRIEYDLWYVDHCSLAVDIKILFLTIARVFANKGVIPGQDVAAVDDLGLYVPDNVWSKEPNE